MPVIGKRVVTELPLRNSGVGGVGFNAAIRITAPSEVGRLHDGGPRSVQDANRTVSCLAIVFANLAPQITRTVSGTYRGRLRLATRRVERLSFSKSRRLSMTRLRHSCSRFLHLRRRFSLCCVSITRGRPHSVQQVSLTSGSFTIIPSS